MHLGDILEGLLTTQGREVQSIDIIGVLYEICSTLVLLNLIR